MKTKAVLLAVFTCCFHALFAQVPEKVAELGNYAYTTFGYDTLTTQYYNLTPNFTVVNNSLFFTVYDTIEGAELWISDGTTGGTQFLKAIDPPGWSYLVNFTSFNGRLYFINYSETAGMALWTSDGTTAGTQALFPLSPATSVASSPSFLININNQLFLLASDSTSQAKLWVCSGGPVFQAVLNLTTLGVPPPICASEFNGKIYFATATDSFQSLWVIDDTSVNIISQVPYQNLNDIYDNYPFYYNSTNLRLATTQNILWFFTESEVYRSDGTSGGTIPVKSPVYNDSVLYTYINEIQSANDKIFFVAQSNFDDGSGYETSGYSVISANETDSAASLLISIGCDSHYDLDPFQAGCSAALDNSIFFSPEHLYFWEIGVLWKSDGSLSGTQFVDSLVNSLPDSSLSGCVQGARGTGSFKVINGELYFIASDGKHFPQVWVSGGEATNTSEIIPTGAINCEPLVGDPDFTFFKDAIYYMANYQGAGQELWRLNNPPNNINPVPRVSTYFSIYPNPANSFIEITAPGEQQIFIYNMLGELALSQYIKPSDIINISSLANGVYLIRNAANTFTTKLVKD